MRWTADEIFETIKMVEMENLDIRTTTLGINLLDCKGRDGKETAQKVYDKIIAKGGNLIEATQIVQDKYGIPIINKRISLTPISLVGAGFGYNDFIEIAKAMDKAAADIGIDYIGGYGALVHKGMTPWEKTLIDTLPEVLSTTKRVVSSINVATTQAGINMDAIKLMGKIIKDIAYATRGSDAIGCAKFVVFANVPEDNPFVAGTFLGVGEPEVVLNVGISGPGVVKDAVVNNPDVDFGELANIIKKSAFKITRAGELIGREVCNILGVPFGVIDLSLAPTPAVGDSVAEILEGMGLERTGTHGTTAALALLNDAVKKGGAMATSYVGGLSGAFIPVSEDKGMIEAVELNALTLDKLEAMTAVCSVGLDMIAIPGDTPAETISAIIADEISIGVINNKTTAVRIIPAPGKRTGDYVNYGGLLGRAPIMPVHKFKSTRFINRGGRIPAPLNALKN